MTSVKVAVVGAGVFGLEHLDALTRSEQGQAVAVCDPNADIANRAADLFRIPHVYHDLADLLRAPGVDAVVIAAPSALHVELATACIAAGKHVLIEKPVAMSSAEIAQLRGVAARHPEVVILPGHVLRHSRDHRRIQQNIADGDIGSVLSFVASRDRERGHHDRYDEVSPTLLTMVHDIDLALWMTGQTPETVTAVGSVENGRGQPSVVQALVRTAEGAVWNLRASWALPSGAANRDRLTVFGSSGFIDYDADPDYVLAREASSAVPFASSGRIVSSDLDEEVEHFLDVIRGSATPAVSLREAEQGLRVAEAVDASVAKGGELVRVWPG